MKYITIDKLKNIILNNDLDDFLELIQYEKDKEHLLSKINKEKGIQFEKKYIKF